jgi:uncharacterized protein (TIGR00159 family)
MMTTEFFKAIVRDFRIADAFDIVFVSVFIYALLAWLRKTTSRTLFIGLMLLAVVYAIARAFQMYMTMAVFQAAVAVLLIALIVVFQEDLRNALERIGMLSRLLGRHRLGRSHRTLDMIVEAVSDLASKRVGALIVIKGNKPLSRHLQGGVRVDGCVSKPLIDSIFDPSSVGHDGAIVIEGDRITYMSTYLPLSKNLREVGSHGTRHAAALGLAEVSDAMVIVVSEEYGDLSVAVGDKLKAMSSAVELGKKLESFCEGHFPKPTETFMKRAIKKDLALKLLSLVIACAAWLFLIHQPGTVQKTFVVPIEYRNVPDKLFVETATPSETRITLSARQGALRLLAPSTLKVSIDLSSIKDGHSVEPQVVVLEVQKQSDETQAGVPGVPPAAL